MTRNGLFAVTAATLALTATAVALRTRQARRDSPPFGRFLEIDGVKLHYWEQGSGEPVVFLHGNGSLIQDFRESGLIRRVAETRRVIVFDRPGYGHSTRDRRRVWSAAEQAELLKAALSRLGIVEAHLFGHSWGVLVALEWALRHPSSVRSLTLASGYYFPTPRIDAPLLAGPAIPVLGDVLRTTLSPVLARLFWRKIEHRLFAPAPVPASFERLPRALILSPRALRASAEESALMIPTAAALSERYDDLEMPVTLIAGDGDRLVDTQVQTMRFRERHPSSRLVIVKGAGHMVQHIDPKRVAETILAATAPFGSGGASVEDRAAAV